MGSRASTTTSACSHCCGSLQKGPESPPDGASRAPRPQQVPGAQKVCEWEFPGVTCRRASTGVDCCGRWVGEGLGPDHSRSGQDIWPCHLNNPNALFSPGPKCWAPGVSASRLFSPNLSPDPAPWSLAIVHPGKQLFSDGVAWSFEPAPYPLGEDRRVHRSAIPPH